MLFIYSLSQNYFDFITKYLHYLKVRGLMISGCEIFLLFCNRVLEYFNLVKLKIVLLCNFTSYRTMITKAGFRKHFKGCKKYHKRI